MRPDLLLLQLWLSVTAPRLGQNRDERERGDIPGWVMITIMSAVLVVAILVVAKTALPDLFNTSVKKVTDASS